MNIIYSRRKSSNYIIHFIFIALCMLIMLPFLIILSASFSDEMEILKHGYSIFPKVFSIKAYEAILINPHQILNSYLITIFSTVLGTGFGLCLVSSFAFVITRKDYKYRNILTFYIFFTMLFNGGMVPSYILIAKWLGMKNTFFALFVPLLVNAFYILLMKGYFQTIPDSLYECAKLDGAGELRIFVSIVLPLSTPALATVGLFFMLQYWNDWFSSIMYTDGSNLLTLQAMLIRVLRTMEFINSGEAARVLKMDLMKAPAQTARMSMCIIAAGPMLLVFPFFQRYFVQGLTIGSIKG